MHPQLARSGQIWLTLALASSATLAQVPAARRLDPPAAPQSKVKTIVPSVLNHQPLPARAPSPTAKPQMPGAKESPADAAQSAPQADRTRMYLGTDAAGTIWARGADYKMRLDTSGADFVPFFGSNAPRNFDLNIALASVSVGGNMLELDTNAAPQRVDSIVTFDRGDVSEVFELAPKSVEQKFVLATLPSKGDVHVRVAFTSELVAAQAADGFHFENEYGYVQYGNATAIDAVGRKLALRSELVDGVIDIEVPAEFAASATLPLVIDPVIITYPVETGTVNSMQPDVVYDGSGGYAMHCWEEAFSAGDHDVYSVIYDIYGNQVFGTAGYVDYTTAYWARPRCAYQVVSDRYMFTAEVGSPGNRAIWGQVRSPYFSYDSGQFMVSDPADSGEKINADVGGDPYFGPAYFLVVYERDFASNDRDIHARLVDGNGYPPFPAIYVDNSGLTIDSRPAISKTNNTGNWNIVWQRETSPGLHDLFGAKVLWQGSVTYPTFGIPGYFLDETNPSVSGSIWGSERFVVACELDYTSDHDILVTLIDGSTAVQQLNLSGAEGSFYLQDQRWPSIECDGAHFACIYSELFSTSTVDYDPLVAELGTSGNLFTLDEGHQYLSFSSYPEINTAIAARRSSNLNNAGAQYVTSWLYSRSMIGGTDDIQAATYAGIVGGPIFAFCGGTAGSCPCGNGMSNGAGCGNSVNPYGAYLVTYGAASTVTDTLTMEYGGMPAGVSALLFQSTNPINSGFGTPFGDGVRCVGTPAFRFPIRTTDGTGYAQYGYNTGDIPISVRGSVPWLGTVMFYQTWYRDGAAYCTPKGTNFTNALQVYWTP